MDPWLSGSDSDRPLGGSRSHTFEDSFLPAGHLGPSNQLVKLSDSEEYVKGLEKKLELLQGKKSSIAGTSRERSCLLKGLSEAREAVVAELLKPDVGEVETGVSELSRTVETNLVLRRIAPEQPVTKEEKEKLVKEAHLDKAELEGEKEEEQ